MSRNSNDPFIRYSRSYGYEIKYKNKIYKFQKDYQKFDKQKGYAYDEIGTIETNACEKISQQLEKHWDKFVNNKKDRQLRSDYRWVRLSHLYKNNRAKFIERWLNLSDDMKYLCWWYRP